jgi:ERO1-like protein beta
MDGPYVDLLRNPERFTGYAGDGSWRIWKAIYQENCFDMVSETGITRGPFAESPHEGNQLHQLLRSLLGKTDRGSEEVCKEKRVFYRIISGLHASISIHICDEFFNRTTGEWEHNLDCFITRIGKHPERLQNVYFNYVLLLRAVTKMAPFLEGYTFCTGDQQEDHRIKVSTSMLYLFGN